MRTLEADYPVQLLCEVVDLPPSTYYYQSHKSDELDLRAALEAIAVQHPRYGSRRLTEELKRTGWQINRKRVQRLMQEENLLVQVRRYCRTTNSEHGYGRYPNLIKHVEIVKPDQVWCADLTYIRLPRQFVYLAVILDIFTRSIRGWELAGNMLESLPKAALERALAKGHPAYTSFGPGSAICRHRVYVLVASGPGANQYVGAWKANRECLCGAVYANAQRGGSFSQRV